VGRMFRQKPVYLEMEAGNEGPHYGKGKRREEVPLGRETRAESDEKRKRGLNSQERNEKITHRVRGKRGLHFKNH